MQCSLQVNTSNLQRKIKHNHAIYTDAVTVLYTVTFSANSVRHNHHTTPVFRIRQKAGGDISDEAGCVDV